MKSIRWKIIVLCVAVMLVPILCLNWYTFRTYDRVTSHEIEERMIDSAFIVGEQYKGLLDGAGVLELERRLRVTEPVIKFITVRIDEEEKRLAKVKALRGVRRKVSAEPVAAIGPMTLAPARRAPVPLQRLSIP